MSKKEQILIFLLLCSLKSNFCTTVDMQSTAALSPQHWGTTWAHYQEQKGQLSLHTLGTRNGSTSVQGRENMTKTCEGEWCRSCTKRHTCMWARTAPESPFEEGSHKRSRSNIIPSWLSQSRKTMCQHFQQSPRLFPKSHHPTCFGVVREAQ